MSSVRYRRKREHLASRRTSMSARTAKISATVYSSVRNSRAPVRSPASSLTGRTSMSVVCSITISASSLFLSAPPCSGYVLRREVR